MKARVAPKYDGLEKRFHLREVFGKGFRVHLKVLKQTLVSQILSPRKICLQLFSKEPADKWVRV